MDLTKISIKRPVSVIMIMFIVLLLGGVSISKMHLALMPDINLPYAIVMTKYNNAGPEEVENLVTDPIESAIAGVENIKNIASSSSEGMSTIEVEFAYGTDMDKAINNIRDRVSMVEEMLPDDVGASTIMKISMDSMPIANVVVSSDTMDSFELDTFAKNNVETRLERQKGIASADISGGSKKEIVIEVNQQKMQGLGIDIATISQMLMSENTNMSGGSIDYGSKKITISNKLKMNGIEDVKKTPIMLSSGTTIKLDDIAKITEQNKEIESISRYNGKSCIIISVTKSSDGNTVTSVNAIKKEVEKIQKENPNIKLEVINETGTLIEKSISNVVGNIFTSVFLSILVLFIFLKNIGLTGVIAVSMPLSIVGTFVLLYFSGTTLNMVSLGGLSIGVGMLVDNSIVVLENIYRYRTTLKYDKVRGSYLGAKEVSTAIIGSTLTTIVVFIPFIFAEGIVLQMMKDLALSVVFSLVMSLVVAMTVVPMLAGNYVENVHRNKSKHLKFLNALLDLFDRRIKKITKVYGKLLAFSVRKKKTVLFLSLGISISSFALLPIIGMEFMPSSDTGVISITLETPKATKLEEVSKESAKFERYLENIKEVDTLSSRMLGNSGGLSSIILGGNEKSNISVNLVNKNERKRTTSDIVEQIRKDAQKMAGIKISVAEQKGFMGGEASQPDIEVELQGDDLVQLEKLSDEMVRQISKIDGTREVQSSIKDETNQIAVKLEKDKIRRYGLSGMQVANQIKNNISGLKATTIKNAGEELDVRITYPKEEITTIQNLDNIKIVTPTGAYIPLSTMISVKMSDIPSSITRLNQTRYVSITSAVYNRPLGSVSADIQTLISQMKFPDGYSASLGGSTEMMNEAFSSLILVIVLAVVLVYMVMASQFESIINPFIIMFSIPLAFTGSWILLFLFGTSISVMALIGILVLVGIVVNNGIVLIEYIDILRNRDGYNAVDAVLTACPTRLRPILMTAMTTILGQIPLIFSNGDNSEMLKGMGLVIAGGLTTSTLLTLLVIPLLYLVFDKITEKFRKIFKLNKRRNVIEIEKQCATWSDEDRAYIDSIDKNR